MSQIPELWFEVDGVPISRAETVADWSELKRFGVVPNTPGVLILLRPFNPTVEHVVVNMELAARGLNGKELRDRLNHSSREDHQQVIRNWFAGEAS